MSDRRKKDAHWLLNVQADDTVSTSDAQLAVLMDLRDELKRLNLLLYCRNFTGIPHTLKAIERQTKCKASVSAEPKLTAAAISEAVEPLKAALAAHAEQVKTLEAANAKRRKRRATK